MIKYFKNLFSKKEISIEEEISEVIKTIVDILSEFGTVYNVSFLYKKSLTSLKNVDDVQIPETANTEADKKFIINFLSLMEFFREQAQRDQELYQNKIKDILKKFPDIRVIPDDKNILLIKDSLIDKSRDNIH